MGFASLYPSFDSTLATKSYPRHEKAPVGGGRFL